MQLDKVLENENFKKNIAFVHGIEGYTGDYASFPDDLLPDLRTVLEKKKISRLYSHQAESWELARERRDFCVVTPTASGKTLTYNLLS